MIVIDYLTLIDVSIHAPVWGATLTPGWSLPNLRVSIHAPVWGATAVRRQLLRICQVSIHAPVWGATNAQLSRTESLQRFNPRPRVGGDTRA